MQVPQDVFDFAHEISFEDLIIHWFGYVWRFRNIKSCVTK